MTTSPQMTATEWKEFLGMNFHPSEHQCNVFNFIKFGTGNAVIDAVAGSGKSTTITWAMRIIDRSMKMAFLAFNKKVVEELTRKINDPTRKIATINSLGASAIRKVYGDKIVLDSRKYRKHIDAGLKSGLYKPVGRLEDAAFSIYAQNIRSLVDLYRVNLCMKEHELLAVIEKYGLLVVDNEVQVVMEAIKWGYHNTKEIDYIDQIWWPVTKKSITQFMDKYDFIFVDECQDLSTCQRELVMRSLTPGGRFIAVGDPQQAIYGFSGADANSFNTLKSLPNTITLPLSVCYRCDKNIIELAKTIVPHIQARPDAGDGIVDDNAKVEHIKDGDMVICRNTAPLVALCMKYISERVKAYVVGKDVGENLINMIKKTNRTEMSEVFKKLEFDLKYLGEKLIADGVAANELQDESTYAMLQDKILALANIADDEQNIDVVISRIEGIFKNDKVEGICLSTVHKAKGLESDRVFIICEDRFYNKRAMRIDWMAEQEHNLVYVAYTRAKHLLGFVRDFEG